jgi:colanic acid/amylovoran biosynthesis glycosyltransferase
MRIAYRLFWYPRLTETFIYDEIDWLTNQGHEVCVVASYDVPGFEDPVAQVKCIVCADERCVASAIRAFRPDHIHTHFGRFAVKFRVADLAQTCNATYSVTIHMSELWGIGALTSDQWRFLWDNPLCTRLIAISNTHKRCMAERGVPWNRIVTVRTPVRSNLFSPGAKSCRANLLSVGRLDPMKGHDILIDAFELVRSRHPEASLKIIGGGDSVYADALRKAAAERKGIVLLGECPRSRVIEEMGLADMFILACRPTPPCYERPGRCDGVPVALLEAMCCSVPVVASEAGAVSELVDSQRGLLCRPNKPRELAAGINRLLSDRPLGLRLAKAARRYVRSRHSERNYSHLLNVFGARFRKG